jgi:hypothetical protein
LQFSALKTGLRTIIKTFAELPLALPPADDRNFIGSTATLASVLIRSLAMKHAAATAFRAAR